MATLNSGFNAKKPGILNVSTTSQPLSTGFLPNGTSVFVEDGNGVKSGLKLGVEIAEVIEPTTKQGITNVSFCDRTYASISDVKLLSTALEVYREEVTNNLETVLEPVISTFNNINTELANNTSRLASAEEFINSFQDLNTINRLGAVESDYVSKNGSTIVGTITFADTGSINMGDRPIRNVPAPVTTNDAVNKNYVDTIASDLQAQIDLLQSQIDNLTP